jgi:uncharacterized protein YndB with AHSA1/START domain
MTKTAFVYVTYISATPEKVWNALIEGEFTKKYWGMENVSDWKPGSKWEHKKVGEQDSVLLVGKVVEFTPHRRMIWTWADPSDAARPEKHSRVTFDLEPIENMMRLTVTHDELEAGSDMENGIRAGWPRVLSSLKSLLETGKPLNTWAGKK